MSFRWPNKDPDETLDYSIDWSRYLGSATISSVQWLIVDDQTTTLSADITASATSITLTDASIFTTNTNDTQLKIGSEILEYDSGGISSNTVTVTRGADSTTAAAHSSGDVVSGGEVPIIASVQVTVNGLTVPANTISNTTTVATIRFSGGTNNRTYKIICRITDSSNLTSERSVRLKIKEN